MGQLGELEALKAEAQFWQIKYFELLGHSNSVIAQLSRPFVAQQVTNFAAAQAAVAAHNGAAKTAPVRNGAAASTPVVKAKADGKAG